MVNISVDGIPLRLIELDDCPVKPIDLSYVVLNVAQRASFILDWERLDSSLVDFSSIWFRVTGLSEMYPTYDPTQENNGLFGTVTGNPLDTFWKGVISFDNKGSIPLYNDNRVPILNVPSPQSANVLEATPLNIFPFNYDSAPKPTVGLFLLVSFQSNDEGVNLGYINGETFSLKSYDNVTSPIESNLLYNYLFDENYKYTHGSIPSKVNNHFHHKNSSFQVIEGSASQPFVLPYNSVVELFIQNTDAGEHPFHVSSILCNILVLF